MVLNISTRKTNDNLKKRGGEKINLHLTGKKKLNIHIQLKVCIHRLLGAFVVI